MSAAPASFDLTFLELAERLHGAIRNRSYQRESRLGASIAAYLAWKRPAVSARTLEILEGYLYVLCLRLVGEHGDLDVDEVTPQMLLDVLAGYEPGSMRLVRSCYRGFFEWAVDWDRAAKNPARRLPRARKQRQRVYEVFTAAEQARLIQAADRLPLPWVQRLRVLCLLDLGVRKDEARLLRPECFDPSAKVVVVRGKGDKERLIPFSDELWRALVTFLNRPLPAVKTGETLTDRTPRQDDHLFFAHGYSARSGRVTWTRPSVAMSARGMHSWWADYLVPAAGVRYRSLHMARHTVGTDLATADADSLTIRDWLGHESVQTTQVYVHNSRSRLARDRAKLDLYRRSIGA